MTMMVTLVEYRYHVESDLDCAERGCMKGGILKF